MNVLVIPEDFRKDEFMLKPIISAILASLGKPNANVRVCQDPNLGGIGQALSEERISEIIDRYKGMVRLFILCVDRDCEVGRRTRLDQLEVLFAQKLAADKVFFAENAWQEVEAWVLAGLDLPNEWSWSVIRSERNVKEVYFRRFAKDNGLLNEPGEGRKTLAIQAARRYDRIKQLCPEDITKLEDKIATWLGVYS